ncbi:MAG: class I SAM-dependent methyltransferase [Anaeroplasmataceae bacterium]
MKGKSKSKYLSYYMGVRASVFDKWLKNQMMKNLEAVVFHIGCGMDSRVLRVGIN